MALIVRKATEKDIPAIYEITKEAFTKYAQDLGLPDKVSALKETYESIKSDLENKHVFIADFDGMPVGSVRYEILSGRVVYISRFGVRLNAHNCGVGKALIQAVEDDVKNTDATCLVLHTCSKIASLVSFYYKAGFYIHSTTHDRGYVRALFCKELNNFQPSDLEVVTIK